MKCKELYRLLVEDGWYPVSQRGSHIKMKHLFKEGFLIFPNHENQEIGKKLEKHILKLARIKKR
jgi:mRNA interferase HicA